MALSLVVGKSMFLRPATASILSRSFGFFGLQRRRVPQPEYVSESESESEGACVWVCERERVGKLVLGRAVHLACPNLPS